MKRNVRRKRFFIIIIISLILLTIFLRFIGCNKKEMVQEPYIKLYLSQENVVEKIGLEEYLIGCVAAEMPANFELEALKAQAVCARTYTMRKIIDKHAYPKGADLADDINTCQAYIAPAEFALRHPSNNKELLDKIKQAVQETKGVIMVYDDKPIDAVYHSTCGGQTVSGGEAWGNEVKYLQAVNCPYCKISKHYNKVQVFSYTDINQALNTKLNSKSKIQINNKSTSPRAQEIKLDEYKYTANQFRQLLNLPSTWLKIKTNKKDITITTKGYGHGVGLCQYGANGMALEKYNYKQILKYYYQDIEIRRVKY